MLHGTTVEVDDSDVFLDVDKSGAADDDVVRADHKLLPNLPTVFVLKILYTCIHVRIIFRMCRLTRSLPLEVV